MISFEAELGLPEGLLEGVHKLTAKDFTEDLLGKKVGVRRVDPGTVIGRQSAGGNDAMNMRGSFKLLTSAVQHTEEANFRNKTMGIARNFQQGFALVRNKKS